MLKSRRYNKVLKINMARFLKIDIEGANYEFYLIRMYNKFRFAIGSASAYSKFNYRKDKGKIWSFFPVG